MSLDKRDDHLWMPFKDFQWAEEEEEQQQAQFELASAQVEYEELADIAALVQLQSELQAIVDRLEQEEPRRGAVLERAHTKNLTKQRCKLTNLTNTVLAVEEQDSGYSLKVHL